MKPNYLYPLIAKIILLLLLVLLVSRPTRQVHAAIITVNSATDIPNTDGQCTLREAIMNANAGGDTTGGDCVAGVAGADTILFASSLNGTPIVLSISGAGEDANATGDLDITDVLTITGNGASSTTISASVLGDRVFHIPGSTAVTMNDLTITGGSVPGIADVSSWGGGILNYGNLTLNRARVTGNNAGSRGGGIYFLTGTSQINASLIDANTSGTSGGGVFVAGDGVTTVVTLTNSTLSGNSAGGSGGGLAVFQLGGTGSSTATLNHITVANNNSAGGGGISNIPTVEGTLNIRNTLVADNSSSGTGPQCSGTITSLGYNHIEDTSGCGFLTGTGDIFPGDPSLAALANNGGPTLTHALGSGSIVINTIPGVTNGCGTTYPADQRGISRPQGASCDKGAYEFVTAVIPGFNGGDGPGGVGDTGGSSALELWLKANQGVFTNTGCTTAAANGNPVACWADQSGNGRNATQGTAGTQPLYVTNAINSQPLLQFDGGNDLLDLPNSTLPSGNTPYTVVVLVNADVLANRGFLGSGNYGNTNEANAFRFGGGGEIVNSWWANDLITNPGTVAAGNNYLLSFVYHTSTGRTVWLDGTIPGGGTNIAINHSGGAGNNTVGRTDASEFWDGTIVETIIFSTPLNDTQRLLVENYLSAKYDQAVSVDLYDGDTVGNGNFDLNVAGIGRFGGINHTQSRAAGMIVVNRNFLQDNGDWLLFGHRTLVNSQTTNDLPTTGDWATAPNPRRWDRHFYIDVTDAAGTTGGTVDIIFDYSEGGMDGNPNSLPNGLISNYRLLGRTGTSGQFSDIATATAFVGDQVHFQGVDVALLGSNFTLGTLNHEESPTAVTVQSLTTDAPDLAVAPILITGLLLLGATAVLLTTRRRRQHTPE